MVNLGTGDFTYSLPLTTVPSPEGGFSLPIFYHSGITPSQEASWAGLGWNVNAGAINRSIVGFADDAYDQVINSEMKDPLRRIWTKNFILYKRSYDSETGYSGEIDLFGLSGISWDEGGVNNVLIAGGVNFGRNGVTVDPVGVGMAALTVASLGTAAAAAGTGKAALAVATELAVNIGVQVATEVIATSAAGGTQNSSKGFWHITQSKSLFRTSYSYSLDYSAEQFGFGSLYLGQMKGTRLISELSYDVTQDLSTQQSGNNGSFPSNLRLPRVLTSKGTRRAHIFAQDKGLGSESYSRIVASDMHMDLNTGSYATTANPSSIGYDNYYVMGQGVQGSIRPYRTDVGTLNFPQAILR